MQPNSRTNFVSHTWYKEMKPQNWWAKEKKKKEKRKKKVRERNEKLNHSGRVTINPGGNPFPTFCGFFLKFVMLQCGHMYSSPSVFA
jgi:hypothetical protein